MSPVLSSDVAIIGRIASDDPLQYDHVNRLGAQWNAIVTVSAAVGEEVRRRQPELASRVIAIPNGVVMPETPPVRGGASALSVIFASRLADHQKRACDVPRIIAALLERQMPFTLSIAGEGRDGTALRSACAPYVAQGAVRFLGLVPHDEVLQLFAQHDAFLMTSAFEGMSQALLEAMARGCVPVVADVRSGVPELLQDGVNGFRVPIGDIERFATRLAELQAQPMLRQRLGDAAARTIAAGGFTQADMAQRYLEVFDRVWDDLAAQRFRRPGGPLLPPPARIAGVGILPGRARVYARQARRAMVKQQTARWRQRLWGR